MSIYFPTYFQFSSVNNYDLFFKKGSNYILTEEGALIMLILSDDDGPGTFVGTSSSIVTLSAVVILLALGIAVDVWFV